MADTTITPATPTTWPASLAVPTPGDNVKAATPPGAVRPAYQALLNGVAAAQIQLRGRVGAQRIEVENNTTMVIRHVGAFTVNDGGTWKTYADYSNNSFGLYSPVVVDPSALVTLDANSRFWVYLRKPTGADPFDVFIEKQGAAPTFPDENLLYRTGDESSTVLSTFYTDDAGNILPYRQIGGLFMYGTRTAIGSGVRGNLILDGGHATSSTGVNWGDSSAQGFRTSMMFYEFAVARAGTPFVGSIMLDATTQSQNIGGDGVAQVNVRTSGSAYGTGTQIYYMVDNAATSAWIWVTGFRLW